MINSLFIIKLKRKFCFIVIVYPPGSMLEMSNGYPHSSSPLGGSPSPGGPPHNKVGPAPPPTKHPSPAPPPTRNNLRVVIPNPHEDV